MRTRRRVVVVDRVVVAVVGLALVALGLLVAAAGSGQGSRLPVELPSRLDEASIGGAEHASWWVPVLAVGGAVLVLVALWWWAAHLPRLRRPAPVRLAGSRVFGRLEVEPGAVARAATRQAAASPHVRSARLRLVREHGATVLAGTVRIGPHSPVDLVARDLTLVARQTADVLGDSALVARIRLAVSHRDTSAHGRAPE